MSKSEPNWEDYGMRDPAFSYKIWRLDVPSEDGEESPIFHDPDWALDPKQLDEKCGTRKSKSRSFLVRKRLGEAVSDHFVVYIKWPDKFGTYGASKTTHEEMDRYVDKLLGPTVEAFNKNGVSLEIGPSIPGRDRRGNPILQVNIYFRKSPVVGRVPTDWSTKFVNSLKRVREVLIIR